MGDLSEYPGFEKTLKEAFPLAKKTVEEAKELDVKIFLKFLKKHKLFGKTMMEKLAKIHDLLKESWQIAEEIRAHPDKSHEEELDRLSKMTFEIEKLRGDVLEDLDKGKHLLTEMGGQLSAFYNDERRILGLVDELYTNMKEKGLVSVKPGVTQLMHTATNMQGAIHKIKPLFEAISTAYEQDSVEIERMLDEEQKKVEDKLKGHEAADINFKPILEHIKYVQGKIEELVDKAEQEAKLEKVAKRDAKLMEVVIGKMLEREPKSVKRL